MRLKRWESPRKEGRNDKGRGGSARQRQLKKQRQMLRKRLQEETKAENQNQTKNQNNKNQNNKQGGENFSSPYFLSFPLRENLSLRNFAVLNASKTARFRRLSHQQSTIQSLN